MQQLLDRRKAQLLEQCRNASITKGEALRVQVATVLALPSAVLGLALEGKAARALCEGSRSVPSLSCGWANRIVMAELSRRRPPRFM